MNRSRTLSFGLPLAALFTLSALASAGPSPLPKSQVIPGEVIVKFRAGQEGFRPLVHASIGGVVRSSIDPIGVELVKLPAGMAVTQAVQLYRANPSVQYAEPNYKDAWLLTPNDPLFPQQYGATQMKLPAAWDINNGDPGVLIAIIDSGVDKNHPDLAANFAGGHDFIDGDDDPTPTFFHGTHVAGIAAAVANNGIGVAGMGYRCRYLGITHDLTVATSAAAMVWSADHGAKVVNMSYGGIRPPSQAEQDAVDYAWSKNVLLVSAAGNSNYSGLDVYPNGYEKVVSVGATTQAGQKADFSDWGPRVDVAGPGVNIISTNWPGNGYVTSSGTSMSSPGVAGVAGLLYAYGGPTVTNTEVRAALEDSAIFIGTWVQKGRVDAEAALARIRPLVPVDVLPNAASVYEGSYVSGGPAELMTSDNAYFQVSTENAPKLGPAASAIVEFPIGFSPSNLRDGTMTLECSGVSGGTTMVFLWDGTKWVSYRQFPQYATDATSTIQFGSTLKDWIKDGKVRVLVRSIKNLRRGAALPYTFKIDRLTMVAKVQN